MILNEIDVHLQPCTSHTQKVALASVSASPWSDARKRTREPQQYPKKQHFHSRYSSFRYITMSTPTFTSPTYINTIWRSFCKYLRKILLWSFPVWSRVHTRIILTSTFQFAFSLRSCRPKTLLPGPDMDHSRRKLKKNHSKMDWILKRLINSLVRIKMLLE